MIEEKYRHLSLSEQEQFARVVNRLLSNTFLLVEEYDPAEGVTRVNREYLFVERNFELFREYLEMSGFRLERDTTYGVIYLTSSYDGSRVQFDKLTTVMIYTLRLIYEEERAKLTLTKEVIITIADLVQKMLIAGAVKKKPANVLLHKSLRALSRFRIIQKLDGSWEAPQNRLLILRTILFVVSNEQISNMEKLVEQKESESDEPEEEPDEDVEYEET